MDEMTLLEKEIQKSVKVRTSVAEILVKNYPIERDLADIIALDTIEQAIGKDRIIEYKKEKRRTLLWSKVKAGFKTGGIFGGISLGSIGILGLIIWAIVGMWSCVTAPRVEYSRNYSAIPENIRFENVKADFNERTISDKEWNRLESLNGLQLENKLCVTGYSPDKTYQGDGRGKTCISPNKFESLNKAMDKAVAENFDGVVWNEPNGQGEVWTVERNNYRFVITANKDENFK